MRFPQACIVLFAKEPVAGKVKTRLIPALGAQGALDLHLKLMRRVFVVTNRLSFCHVQLWVDHNTEHPAFDDFKGEHKLQVGADLGLKMHHAIARGLEEYASVVIIGSDCPQMDEGYLLQALEALEDHDVVVGPASDGGYVLIGMNKAIPEVFEGVEWGSARVFEQTRQRLVSNHVSWRELPELFDIDRPEDLKKL